MMSNWMGVPGTIRSSGSGALEVFWDAPLEDCIPPGLALQKEGGKLRERKSECECTIRIPEITHAYILYFPLGEIQEKQGVSSA
jgi:hypothetical protein